MNETFFCHDACHHHADQHGPGSLYGSAVCHGCGWLRLRAGASFEADTITSYYTDTVVEILGAASGNWYRVKTPDGRTGYMYGDYLKLGASGSSTANAHVTSHNGYGVRMRKGPGTGYRVIRTYAVGTPVTILESGTYWSRISINGTIGYMMSQFLSTGVSGGNSSSAQPYLSMITRPDDR